MIEVKRCMQAICLLGNFLIGSSQACHDHDAIYIKEAQEKTYTANHYTLPSYTEQELASFVCLSPTTQWDKWRNALINRKKKWLVTPNQPQPEVLWRNYKKEVLDPWLNKQANAAELEPYFQAWETFLKEPNQTHQIQLETQAKKCKDLKQQFDQKLLMGLYNSPEAWVLKQEQLDYEDFIAFIWEKPSMHRRTKFDAMRTYLHQWKHDNNNMRSCDLWKQWTKQHASKLKRDCIHFQYEENQQAVATSLALLDDFATQPPYQLTHKAWRETIPHGLNKLKLILDEATEAGIGESDPLRLLNAYRRLATHHVSSGIG